MNEVILSTPIFYPVILPSLVQEGLLKELERIYHPQHNLPIDVKFNLVPLYGRQTG
jgi:hypothetical protein